MQSVLNSVKGTALGVAEYLTPVLKVRFISKNVIHLLQFDKKLPLLFLLFFRNPSFAKLEF